MEVICHTLEETEKEAERFIRTQHPCIDGATLITLSGELGAGKTAFVKCVANTLGIREQITSPTFVLEKIYDLPEEEEFSKLIHIDAYRLKNGTELSALGFDEIMCNPKNILLLEWPEQVADALPVPAESITFEILPDESRKITYA